MHLLCARYVISLHEWCRRWLCSPSMWMWGSWRHDGWVVRATVAWINLVILIGAVLVVLHTAASMSPMRCRLQIVWWPTWGLLTHRPHTCPGGWGRGWWRWRGGRYGFHGNWKPHAALPTTVVWSGEQFPAVGRRNGHACGEKPNQLILIQAL